MRAGDFQVILFDSVSSTLFAEKILKKKGVEHKIIPVPRHISSDCGVCIRFRPVQRDEIEQALSGRVTFQDICPL
ncbi:MAG TPA: DUF3343 domain-containing protein [Deltaproteobacteria bacterium]|nr:DUF3343 domain-containing protein [Deltaproteobacteria bacterium]